MKVLRFENIQVEIDKGMVRVCSLWLSLLPLSLLTKAEGPKV